MIQNRTPAMKSPADFLPGFCYAEGNSVVIIPAIVPELQLKQTHAARDLLHFVQIHFLIVYVLRLLGIHCFNLSFPHNDQHMDIRTT